MLGGGGGKSHVLLGEGCMQRVRDHGGTWTVTGDEF